MGRGPGESLSRTLELVGVVHASTRAWDPRDTVMRSSLNFPPFQRVPVEATFHCPPSAH